jgi:hypothetical protein
VRLKLDEYQLAINEAIHIDASPHEWPKEDKIPLLCNAFLDAVETIDRLSRMLKEETCCHEEAKEELKRLRSEIKAARQTALRATREVEDGLRKDKEDISND